MERSLLRLAHTLSSDFRPTTRLPIYIPTNSPVECPFHHQHLLFVIFDNSHSYRYDTIPHCGFDLHFLMISDEHLFMCLLATVYRLSKNAHFKNQVVCFLIELYEFFVYFEYQPLLDVSFTNIFSHSVDHLFILLMFPLLYKKYC